MHCVRRPSGARYGLILVAIAVFSSSVGSPEALGQSRKQRLTEAKRHYQQGKAAFELGQFQQALQSYEEAYRIAALPGLLFNIGQCYRNLGELEKASFSFRLYLRKLPNARNRVAVEQLLAELSQQIAAERERRRVEKERREREAQQERERERRAREAELERKLLEQRRQARLRGTATPIYKKWWFWTLIGVAAGGIATGVYFGVQGGSDLPSSPFSPWEVSR